jgi:hypothetical protein
MEEVNWYLGADPPRKSTVKNSELPAASKCQDLWKGRMRKKWKRSTGTSWAEYRELREAYAGARSQCIPSHSSTKWPLMSETQRLQRQVLQGWAVNPAGEDNAAWTRAGRVHSVDS